MAKKRATSEHGSRLTTNHDEIRRWVEARGGKPATVTGTEDDDEAGILRIDFPGYSGADSLQEIPWEEFFEKFEEKGLAFLSQDQTAGGDESRFFKFVTREAAGAAKDEPKSKARSTAKAKDETKVKSTTKAKDEPAAKDETKVKSTTKAKDQPKDGGESEAKGTTKAKGATKAKK
jgi:hypothetical protein